MAINSIGRASVALRLGATYRSGRQACEVAELSAVGDMGKGSYSNLFSSRVKLAFFVLFL